MGCICCRRDMPARLSARYHRHGRHGRPSNPVESGLAMLRTLRPAPIHGPCHHGLWLAGGDRGQARMPSASRPLLHGRCRPRDGPRRARNPARSPPADYHCLFRGPLPCIDRAQATPNELKNLGVDFPGTNFVAVARAFGGCGIRVSNWKDLEGACEAALRSKTFTLIEAVVDKAEYDGQIL